MPQNETPEEQVDITTPEVPAVVEPEPAPEPTPEPTPEPEVQPEPAATVVESAPVVVDKNAGKTIPTAF